MVSVYDLYNEMIENGILLFDYKQNGTAAATIRINETYGVFLDSRILDTLAKEKTIVAHECGHCFTGSTHAIYSPFDVIEKHEYKANKWAAHRVMPIEEIKKSLRDGCVEPWQLAERFNVTEDFVKTALYIYQCEDALQECVAM